MRLLVLFSATVLSLSQLGEAAIIFSLSPATQSIVQGTVGQFDLSVRTDVAGGQQITALEANVVSSAPNSLFTSASQTFLLTGVIDRSTPGQAFISTSLAGGISLGTTDTLFARLFLSTTNVALGNYTMSLNQLAANSPTLAGLPIQNGGTVSFTVVPEPTSMALVALVVSGLGMCRFVKRKKSEKVGQ